MNNRNTIQREQTLKAVKSLGNHPTAEEVYIEVSSRNPHISKGTVYRNLGVLSDAGKIRKLLMPGNVPDRYDWDLKEHTHGVCRCCGKIFDINLSKRDIQAEGMDGFQIEGYQLLFEGVCKDCQKEEENKSACEWNHN